MTEGLPPSWRVAKIENSVSLKHGKFLPRELVSENGTYPVYGSNGIIGRTNQFLHDKPTIVIGRVGASGEIHLTKEPAWFSDNSIYVSDLSPTVDLGFLYYFLRFSNLSQYASKTSQPLITQSTIKKHDLVIPPISVQKRIADILNRANMLRQKREQANQMTNKILQAVFFKIFGNKPPENKVGDIAELVSSGATPLGGKKTYLAEGVVFIREQNVHMNELRLDDVAYISQETHKQMNRTWVKNGDVLLNITGASLGRVAVYSGPDDGANVNQHVCIIRVNKNKTIPEYVSYYLSSQNAQNEIWTIQAGASRQALNFNQVRSLRIYLPPFEEQKEFASFVGEVRNLRNKQIQSTREITNIFNSLMSKAFKGELVRDIPETERPQQTPTLTDYMRP